MKTQSSSPIRALFGIHAVVTCAAAVVLVVAPGTIPSTVGIRIEPGAYLLCYLLAGAEFAIAALSWGARTITDAKALRLIIASFIVLHAATGLLEVYAFRAMSAAILANVALRVVAVAAFSALGLRGWKC